MSKTIKEPQVNQSQPLATESTETLRAAEADGVAGLAAIKDAANKIALTVRLLTVLKTPDEQTKAQNMLEARLIDFAAAINTPRENGK